MARGFLSGIAIGAAASVLGLGVASYYGPRVELTVAPPPAASDEVPPGSENNPEIPQMQVVPPQTQTEARPGSAESPQGPAVEDEPAELPTADTAPAAAPETEAVEESGLPAPEPGDAPDVRAGAEEAVLPAPGALQPPEPAVDLAPITDGAAEAAAPAPEQPATGEEAASDEPAKDEATGEEPAADEAAGIAPTPAPDAPPSTLPGDTVGIRLPVPEIGDMAPGVTTGRLPSIGEQPAAEAPAQPALEAYAVPFDGVEGAPAMAVVLLDPGPDRADPAELADFPVPVTVAINAVGPDAAEATAAYRSAGLEVVAFTPLPPGATPADVEVAFEGFLRAVPEAVAVLDVPDALLQENRPRAAQVADILAATGHGMITYDKGLNAGLQVASGAGVKAATVFRNFDDGERDGAAMKRFLDQGAFRAGQDGGIVMIGQLRPETLSALAEWALGTRAEAISLAPVSALLMRQ